MPFIVDASVATSRPPVVRALLSSPMAASAPVRACLEPLQNAWRDWRLASLALLCVWPLPWGLLVGSPRHLLCKPIVKLGFIEFCSELFNPHCAGFVVAGHQFADGVCCVHLRSPVVGAFCLCVYNRPPLELTQAFLHRHRSHNSLTQITDFSTIAHNSAPGVRHLSNSPNLSHSGRYFSLSSR